jgi:hypothetical protein
MATLLAFGIGSVLVALLAIRRTRRMQNLLLASPRPVPAGA